ncbi:dermonecrotic toxin domain-containing protein [Pseudomonas asplenii]|uniref:dermonecrotic toxin domain-containing protein n=1 Tax=Pseudomonas asplenii TaxID=53407 RepID=UPI0003638D58|nr:DUF6543 domain-containing protein [Pseudomonas fuscovaginae]
MTVVTVTAPVSESDQALHVFSLNDCLAARPSLESATADLVQAMLDDAFPGFGKQLRNAAFINLMVSPTGDGPAAYQVIPLSQRLIDCWLGQAAPVHPQGSYLALDPDGKYPSMLGLRIDRVEQLISEWAPALLETYKQSLVDFWSSPALSRQMLPQAWQSSSAQDASPWQRLSDFIVAQLRKASSELTGDELDTVEAVLDYPDYQTRRLTLGEDCTKACITLVDTGIRDPEPLFQQALALTRQVGEQQIVLLYTLLGGIKAFDSIDALETALGWTLSDSAPSLGDYSPDNHVFDALAAALLMRQLESIRAIRPGDYSDRVALDQRLHELTGPQALLGAFRSGHEAKLLKLHDLLPDWLRRAPTADRALYGRYVSRLSEVHRLREGKAFLDGIPRILEFAERALAKSLVKLNPEAEGVSVAHIRVTLTRVDNSPLEALDPGFIPFLDLRTASSTRNYTDMALENIEAFPFSAIPQIHYDKPAANGAPAPAPEWMTYELLRAAVNDADIGGNYPALLKRNLQRYTVERARQKELFTLYMQVLLPMLALELRLTQKLTERARLYVSAVMSMDASVPVVSGLSIVVRPLALLAHPGAAADHVLNHFVIGPRMIDQGPQVLLRPGAEQPLLEFASLAHLLAAIQAEEALQQSILAGLDEHSRRIYDQGGFLEPHLTRVILSDWDLPEIPEPPTLDTTILSEPITEALFVASVEVLVRHAETISVSNAEARHKRLVDLGWALFGLLIPWAPSALVGVGLIVQLLPSLKALADHDTSSPWAAFADVLLNLAAVLVYHRRLSLGRSPVAGFADTLVKPAAGGSRGLLAYIWTRRGRGLTATERERLDRFRLAAKAPSDLLLIETGERRGLYQRGGLFYASIDGEWFHVLHTLDGLRIADPAHPARLGPWVTRSASGAWRLDRGPLLLGGAGELSVRGHKKLKSLEFQARQLLDSLSSRLAGGEKSLRTAHGPADIEDLLKQDAALFSDLSLKLQELTQGMAEYPEALVGKLDGAAQLLRAQGVRLRIERVKLDPPSVMGVSYLKSQKQITIRPLGARKDISGGKGRDFLQEYEIADLRRTPLWYAHFHYPSLDAAKASFTAAHLKTPGQRFQGIRFQMAQEQSGQRVDRIHRPRIDKNSADELFLSLTR